MRDQLESLNYQQLLKVARQYNLGVSIPLPAQISKEDLIGNILKHAKEVGRLLSVLESVRGETKPSIVLKKVKRTPDISEEEFASLERRRERGMREIKRAEVMFGEPEEKKQLKKRLKEIKERYSK